MALRVFWDKASNVLLVNLQSSEAKSLPVALKFMRTNENGDLETFAILPVWSNKNETVTPNCALSIPPGVRRIQVWPLFALDQKIDTELYSALAKSITLVDIIDKDGAGTVCTDVWSVNSNRQDPFQVMTVIPDANEQQRDEARNADKTVSYISQRVDDSHTPATLSALTDDLPRLEVTLKALPIDPGDTSVGRAFDVTIEIPDDVPMADIDINLKVGHLTASGQVIKIINGAIPDDRALVPLQFGASKRKHEFMMPARIGDKNAEIDRFGFLDRLTIEADQPVELVFMNGDAIRPRTYDGFMVLAHYEDELFVMDQGEMHRQIARNNQFGRKDVELQPWQPSSQVVSQLIGEDLKSRTYKLPLLVAFGAYQHQLRKGNETSIAVQKIRPQNFGEFAVAASLFGLLVDPLFLEACASRPPSDWDEQKGWLHALNTQALSDRLRGSGVTAPMRKAWLSQFDEDPWALTELLICCEDIAQVVELGLRIAPYDPSDFVRRYAGEVETLANLREHEESLRHWRWKQPKASSRDHEAQSSEVKLMPLNSVQDRVLEAEACVSDVSRHLASMARQAGIYHGTIPEQLASQRLDKSEEEILELAGMEIGRIREVWSDFKVERPAEFEEMAARYFVQKMSRDLAQIEDLARKLGVPLSELKRPEQLKAAESQADDFDYSDVSQLNVSGQTTQIIQELEGIFSDFKPVNDYKGALLSLVRRLRSGPASGGEFKRSS